MALSDTATNTGLAEASHINELRQAVLDAQTKLNHLNGGLAGQALIKATDSSFDTTWQTIVGSGSGLTTYVASVDSPASIKSKSNYVCDGTADQEEINAALTSLAAFGGSVTTAPGRFYITAPISRSTSSTGLVGSGMGTPGNTVGTQIILAAGFVGVAAVIDGNAAGTAVTNGGELRNMTIDGSNVAGGIHGYLGRVQQGTVSRVRIARFSGDGFRLEGFTSSTASENTLDRCIADGNTGSGYHLSSNANDTFMNMCESLNNADAGIRIRSAGNIISGMRISGVRVGVWFDNNGARTKFDMFKIANCQQDGILFDNTTVGDTDVIIGMGTIENVSQAGTGLYDYIKLSNLSSQALLKMNLTAIAFANTTATGGAVGRYCINAMNSATQQLSMTNMQFPGLSATTLGTMNIAGTAILVNSRNNNYSASSIGRGDQQGKTTVTPDSSGQATIPLVMCKTPSFYTAATLGGNVVTILSISASAMVVQVTNAITDAFVTTALDIVWRVEI
jgi:hypothetical protein